jgi:hypothetical protein
MGIENTRRPGSVDTPHYLSMIDLYALRAARNRVVPLERAVTPPIAFIGRKPRLSLAVLASRDRGASLLSGRRIASVATASAILLAIIAR